MTADDFRDAALSLPGAVESAHGGHPDFRVEGKVFASLGPDGDWGMVKLTPDEQAAVVRSEPGVFEPFAGAWGKRGCTRVKLAVAHGLSVRQALTAAWRNTAPKWLVKQFDGRT